MISLELFVTFVKIGILSFGGGYAMISVAWREILSRAWISPSEFVNIIAIAEMTPGPIAVNLATYTGYTMGGLLGGFAATTGVATPSFIIILIISRILLKYQKHPVRDIIFYGIRLVTAGLIAAAAVFVAQTAIFYAVESSVFGVLFTEPFRVLNLKAILILILTLTAQLKFKIHPVVNVFFSGILGILLFYVF